MIIIQDQWSIQAMTTTAFEDCLHNSRPPSNCIICLLLFIKNLYENLTGKLRAHYEPCELTCISDVHNVKLSLNNCMIRVLSLYDSSPRVSSSAIASSNACSISMLSQHMIMRSKEWHLA